MRSDVKCLLKWCGKCYCCVTIVLLLSSHQQTELSTGTCSTNLNKIGVRHHDPVGLLEAPVEDGMGWHGLTCFVWVSVSRCCHKVDLGQSCFDELVRGARSRAEGLVIDTFFDCSYNIYIYIYVYQYEWICMEYLNMCGIFVDAFWWKLFTPLVDGTVSVKHKFSQVAPPDRQICGLKLGNQSMETMDGSHMGLSENRLNP